jgi:hypothetical protein
MARILPSKPGGSMFKEMKRASRPPKANPVLGGNAALRPPRINPPGINSGFGGPSKNNFGAPVSFKPSKPSGVGGIPSLSTANRKSTSRFGF